MASFASYYLQFLTAPHQAATRLTADPGRLRFGSLAVLLTAILYSLVYVFLVMGGGRPFKPWLAIPPESYYRYNVWWLAPSMFLCWIVAAGLGQLASRIWSGSGSFEDMLSVFGFGIAIASWTTLGHDLISSFLGAVRVIDQRAYEAALNQPTPWRRLLWTLMAAYVVWFPVMFTQGVRAAQRIRAAPAAAVGIVAFLGYQFLFFVFNR